MHKRYIKNFTGRLITTAVIAVLQIIVFMVSVALLGTYAIQFNLLLSFISLIVVVIVINQRKNPAYKLTWAILILAMPLFGGLMYLVAMFQSSTFRFKKKAAQARAVIKPYMVEEPGVACELRRHSRTKYSHAAYLMNKARYPLYKNTSAVYFSSGEAKFEWLKSELKRARRFIFLEYFIIQEGVMWDTILKILIEKVKEGVEVRLIYDGMGCYGTLPKNYDKTLENLGIKVTIFNPFMPIATIIQNNRDHRKIVVIDGHTAFCGGVNLADEYINAYDRFGHWKDAAIMLRGDAVRSFTLMFLETWYMYNAPDDNIEEYLYHPSDGEFVISDKSCAGFCQPYADTPLDGECVGELVYFNLINKAKDYIYITTPYLIPDNELMTALCYAAKSGIDVRIITPHIPDKWYVFEVTRAFYGELLDSGVRIYEYTPGFIHSKICVSDDSLAVVGSINFDYRSLYLHFECATMIYNNPVVMDIKQDFLDALNVSSEITPAVYKRICRRSGILMSILRIFAPLF